MVDDKVGGGTDKVEQISGIIGNPKSWNVVAEQTGELVLVDVPGRPGAKQKMRKSEVIRLGLWKEEERGAESVERKAQQSKRNKMRRPAVNKGA
jgi:hypothetical protein